jgi:two-component system chemotaxis response regulator CheB
MRKVRILVADDAVVVRRMLSDALSSDPMLEVVGAAANGRIALAKIPQVNPDVVVLDVEMPEMDGLEALAGIRKTYPMLPVIMFSTLTQRGAASTLDALALGANDYVTKPANVGGAAQAIAAIREQLVPKIKLFCARAAGFELSAAGVPPIAPSIKPRITPRPVNYGARVEVVALGISTGGPNALAKVVPEFPKDFPVPIVIAQHMPPIFTKLLADRLSAQSQVVVDEGSPGRALEPGKVWIAPGNFHMELERDGAAVRLRTHQGPPENSCRPAVDVLFRSVAKTYGAGVLAVVMTGMGHDGLRGCEHVREAGGQVLVQDEATSVVWGMPGFVAKAGLADRALPLDEIGPEIIRRVIKGRASAGFNLKRLQRNAS